MKTYTDGRMIYKAKLFFIGCMLYAIQPCSGQQITGTDPTDKYIQHQVIRKNDSFFFTKENLNKRNNMAQFDSRQKTGEYPSFKMDYEPKKQELFFFRLRHPLVVMPYTMYELTFVYRASAIKTGGPYLQFAVYDETRETLVESHKVTIGENKEQWTQQSFRFTTGNKARFARLLIKSVPGNAGNVLLNDIVLRQLSEPRALQPAPQKIIENKEWIFPGQAFNTGIAALTYKKYYAITLDLEWNDEFQGQVPLRVEWLAEKEGSNIVATDKLTLTNIDGILPEWNGVEAEWKREGVGQLDFISREKEKKFNQDKTGGKWHLVFRMDKPAGAAFMRVAVPVLNGIKGRFEIVTIKVEGEY